MTAKLSMTPEEAARRAVACTATGVLSGLPKWEHGVARKIAETIAQNADNYAARQRVEQVTADLRAAGVTAVPRGRGIIIGGEGVEQLAGLLRKAGEAP